MASFLLAEKEGLPEALLSPAPQVCSASGGGGSLYSAVFFLLNQLRRDYTFLEDVSTIIGKFHPAVRVFFFFSFSFVFGQNFLPAI